MIQGWTEVVQYGKIPPNVRVDASYRNYGINPTPKIGDYGRWFTEEQECPDCQFKCSINDPMGYHTCPEVKIGTNSDLIHVGEFVYFTAHDKVARGIVTKYKKSTGNIGIRNIETQANFNVNKLGRIMKASEDEQRYFEQVINGPI